MDVLFVSDLHSEFYIDKGKALVESLSPADVVCVAGDLGTSKTLTTIIDFLCQKYPKVICVLGNHDYFYSSFARTKKEMEKARTKNNNLIWLENERVVIENQAFIGCTLWYEPDHKKDSWCDFNYIHRPNSITRRHRDSVQYLKANIQEGDVVITHMMPSHKCVIPKWQGNPWNPYFVGDCESAILDNKPKIWHYGHTHTDANFIIGQTRMMCNPSGYPDKIEGSFIEDLIVRF